MQERSSTIKMGFLKMIFAKIKLVLFNLHSISCFSCLESWQRINSFTVAARNGDVGTVERMLQARMTVDALNWLGRTAFHRASWYNQTDVIKILLREGVDVNRPTRYKKETPLHWAVEQNNTELVRLLVSNSADITVKNVLNQTPLDLAHKGSEAESLLQQLEKVRHKGTVNRKSLV